MLEFESILDAPKEGLDPDVWKSDDSGAYVLTDDAKGKIGALVEYVSSRFGLKSPSVRITGSITSNQYGPESDIDVHISFEGLTEENSDDLNKVLRADFDENFKDLHTDCAMIAQHPLEVYFQANPYQDLMSVGCYDFVQGMWLVGPDLKPLDFDPYSEFYSDDMKYVEGVLTDIRSVILECYETATVIQNSNGGEFKRDEFEELKTRIVRGVEIYQAAR
jgi:predicted nucleotidyltransferase